MCPGTARRFRSPEMGSPRPPVIGFLTDFGFDGAAATCRGVMLSICPDAQIVDVSHSIAKYAVADGAFVLAAALPFLPIGHHVAVVDPGVGTARRGIALRAWRGDVLVGPDNGLLIPAADALGGVADARLLQNRELWLPQMSSTFHGRDIFAPVAAHLAAGAAPYEAVGPALDPGDLVGLPVPALDVREGRIGTEVVYVDSFGNLRLAGGRAELEAAFGGQGAAVTVAIGGGSQLEASIGATFGAVPRGATLLYVDSSGHLALADNQGDLATRIGAAAGAPVVLERP